MSTEDLRVRRTHKLLYEAFVELVQTKSIDEMSITDICDKAMVNRATFYKHFEDKYEFFCYCIKIKLGELRDSIPAITADGSIIAYYTVVVERIVAFLKENPLYLVSARQSLSRYAPEQMLHDLIMGETMKSLERYEAKNGALICPREIVAECITGAIASIAKWAFAGERSFSLDEISYYLRNLSTDINRIFQAVPHTGKTIG